MAVQALGSPRAVYLVSIKQVGVGSAVCVAAGGWQAIRRAPALLLGVSVGLLLRIWFSQAPWIEQLLRHGPLGLREWFDLPCPLLAMLPVSFACARLDPTRALPPVPEGPVVTSPSPAGSVAFAVVCWFHRFCLTISRGGPLGAAVVCGHGGGDHGPGGDSVGAAQGTLTLLFG